VNRRIATVAGTLVVAVLLATRASAGVNISNKPTQNMSCSAGICTATAKQAYLNVKDVTSMLAAGDLKITTGSGAEDIHIDAPFSWTSPSRLTLDAQRSIEFRKPVTVAGVGGLTLITNDGGTGGDYWFDPGASVSFWDTKSSLMINGQTYALVKDIKTLSNDVSANPSGSFALASSYDASADGTYKNSPVGTVFSGHFDGLGNTISNLALKQGKKQNNNELALFASLTAGGIRDLLVEKATVRLFTADEFAVAILVATNSALISHCHVSGRVEATGGQGVAGGLVGENGGTVTDSSANSKVKIVPNSSSGANSAGALTGDNQGAVEHSSSRGNVQGTGQYLLYVHVGGLVGSNHGHIDASHSSATIKIGFDGDGGGLVGYSSGLVSGSYASGPISGGHDVGLGGLVGRTDGGPSTAITTSYATGDVSAGDSSSAGGLAGASSWATIDKCFDSGNVAVGASSNAGGIIGVMYEYYYLETILMTNSYATGSVQAGAGSYVGGALGLKYRQAQVSQIYSLGSVIDPAGGTLGGFVGEDVRIFHKKKKNNHIAAANWDLDTSGISDPSQGAGNLPNDRSITGLTDVQLKSGLPAGFDPAIWAENPSINNGYPYLLANPPPK
jgi:hypothetical protein